jgi:hypothetical protein
MSTKKNCDHTWKDIGEFPVVDERGKKYILTRCSKCNQEQVVRVEEKRIRVVSVKPGPDVYLRSAYTDLAYILSQYDDKDVSDDYENRNSKPLLEAAVHFCNKYIQINGGKRIKLE